MVVLSAGLAEAGFVAGLILTRTAHLTWAPALLRTYCSSIHQERVASKWLAWSCRHRDCLNISKDREGKCTHALRTSFVFRAHVPYKSCSKMIAWLAHFLLSQVAHTAAVTTEPAARIAFILPYPIRALRPPANIGPAVRPAQNTMLLMPYN